MGGKDARGNTFGRRGSGAEVTEYEPGVCYRNGYDPRDYEEAIHDLRMALQQRNSMLRGEAQMGCEVCGDSGHTVESCHHDPLKLARRYTEATSIWVCYHCGTVCRNDEEAKAHFGSSEDEVARCLAEARRRL